MVKLVVFAIHGIGNPDSKYYDTFDRRLRRYLNKADISNEDYLFRGIWYSEVFEEEANKISEMTEDLNWKGLRRFITHSLGDALAYQSGVSSSNRINFYQKVHQRIDQELISVSNHEEVSPDTPVLFIAHSLGAYIISNYIWDKQNNDEAQGFLSMDNLCGLITMGCNIPILTLGFDYDKLYPITLPGKNLYDFIDDTAIEWLNIYDKNDPLAIPLENFYSHKNKEQEMTLQNIRDMEMNVGNLLARYTPLSHSKYWNHKRFIYIVRDRMIELLKLFEKS